MRRKLSYAKRKDIFDALDWYHVKSLYLTKDAIGNPVFTDDLPIGSWPTNEMQDEPSHRQVQALRIHQVAED